VRCSRPRDAAPLTKRPVVDLVEITFRQNDGTYLRARSHIVAINPIPEKVSLICSVQSSPARRFLRARFASEANDRISCERMPSRGLIAN
jgi:hypothetical protein